MICYFSLILFFDMFYSVFNERLWLVTFLIWIARTRPLISNSLLNHHKIFDIRLIAIDNSLFIHLYTWHRASIIMENMKPNKVARSINCSLFTSVKSHSLQGAFDFQVFDHFAFPMSFIDAKKCFEIIFRDELTEVKRTEFWAYNSWTKRNIEHRYVKNELVVGRYY